MSVSTAVPTDEVTDTRVPVRAARALNEHQTVLALGGGVFEVVAEGPSYRVDLREGRCTCRDHQMRGVTCKHQWRAAFAVGVADIPERIEPTGDLNVYNGSF